jgi:hypothetical protein
MLKNIVFKTRGITAGAILALAVCYFPWASIPAGLPAANAGTATPANTESSTAGRYTEDGGKTWTTVREEKGIVERLPAGTKQTEFMETSRMSPEAEAKIIHQVPLVPVIIDGVLYQPEEIHKFDGQQLGFTVGSDGQLYAFTDEAALENFITKQSKSGFFFTLSIYSRFCEGYYLSGMRQLEVPPGVSMFSLGSMDNIISSMDISAYADNGITLFDLPNLQGDYFHGYYWIQYPNLGTYGWDNRASSLVVWPQ